MRHAPDFALHEDRRIYSRREMRALAYIDLGNDNGGIVLNMSEGGLAVQTGVALNEQHLPNIRFQLPQSSDWVEARGEIAWTSKTRMQAGVRFIALSDQVRRQIRDWAVPKGGLDDPLASRHRLEVARVSLKPDLPICPTAAAPRALLKNAETSHLTVAPVLSLRSGRSATGSIRPSQGIQHTPARPGNAGSELSLRQFEATQPESRVGWRTWSGFVALLAALAALSFLAGLTAGRGDFRRLVAKLSKVAGRADSASPQSPSNTAGGTERFSYLAAPSAVNNGRVTITSRMYVPVATPNRFDASQVDRLQVGTLEDRVEPQYPPEAAAQHAEGTVQLHVTIGASGAVEDIALLGGPPLLVQSATDAVRQWRYKPTLLDGKPVETEADVAIVFWLPPSAQRNDR